MKQDISLNFDAARICPECGYTEIGIKIAPGKVRWEINPAAQPEQCHHLKQAETGQDGQRDNCPHFDAAKIHHAPVD